MELNTDTIAAVSTAPGVGGIAVIRISGPQALPIFAQIWKGKGLNDAQTHTAHFGTIADSLGRQIDECVATLFRAPKSFTGEDTVEISCHGSEFIQREILHAVIRAGARTAEPGEFTRRAFLNGRMDLAQAEGIADLIAASSRAAHDIALSQTKGAFSASLESMRAKLTELASLIELELDFSEEDVEFADRTRLLSLAEEILGTIERLTESYSAGQAMREGIDVAIAGMPNAGKSTLLNCLVADDKAIVSDIPGTTRDTIEATAVRHGLLFRFIDTAGLRQTDDTIENLGIRRAITALQKSRYVFWLIDPTADIAPQMKLLHTHTESLPADRILILINKYDIAPDAATGLRNAISNTGIAQDNIFLVSAAEGTGTEKAIETIANKTTSGYDPMRETVIANARHYETLTRAADSLQRTIDGLTSGLPSDFVAQDLRETLTHLGTITGSITTPDLLTTIFSRFCIGK